MSLRIPAIIPARPQPAGPILSDPSALIEASLRQTWETAMRDLPFVNPAIGIEAVGFRRIHGDWIGIAVTPWSINLLLVPGGGTLWQDVATGEHRQLAFPAGPLEFIADNNPDRSAPIQAWQYCPLITQMNSIADHGTAVATAREAFVAIFQPPPEVAVVGDGESPPQAAQAPAGGRRAFLRGVVRGRQ